MDSNAHGCRYYVTYKNMLKACAGTKGAGTDYNKVQCSLHENRNSLSRSLKTGMKAIKGDAQRCYKVTLQKKGEIVTAV